jgi:GNAT superfamily N-acetyltransferase
MTGGGYTITEHDPATYTKDEMAVGVEFGNKFVEEILPGEEPTPVDVAWAAHQSVPARYRRFEYRAIDADGNLVGAVGNSIDPDDTDNPDILGCGVAVLPAHRRQGLGSRLLAYMVALARQEDCTRLIGHTYDTVPGGAAFAGAVGAETKSAMHMNHLPTAEVDRALMEKWVAQGPARADGYELLTWDGAIPEEHLQDFIDLFLVMNDAPRDDFEMNDFTLTPAEWREGEEQSAAVGAEHWTVVARRKSDGALAGFHDMTWAPHEPLNVYVGSTGVRPEHRGHALGKWLKAAVTLRVLDERPDVEDIRTGNADSNDAMLGINREMGYRPLIGADGWEVAVDVAAKYLAARGIDIPALTPR